MNIAEAKQEVIHTILCYTAKDENGKYQIPLLRQRPLLLIGPPGIGKTAIMEQAAAAADVGFVSYTMTHHTRQSAIGLPMVAKEVFAGEEKTVTEYTMSEIIASVYRMIEHTGKKEGLLFLDEINCISETLTPAILQFLQTKMFGGHRLPEGWILAAAGNPREYNRSVHEFDIATLDRIKYIEVEADYSAWRSYALGNGMHGAILAYLDLHRDHFYLVKSGYSFSTFVTARGWEDLSHLLRASEALSLPVGAETVKEYLHNEEVAQEFAVFLNLYRSRKEILPLKELFAGEEKAFDICREFLLGASFSEQLLVANLLLSDLGDRMTKQRDREAYLRTLADTSEKLQRFSTGKEGMHLIHLIEAFLEHERAALLVLRQYHIASDELLQLKEAALTQIQRDAFSYLEQNQETVSFLLQEQIETREGIQLREKEKEQILTEAARILDLFTAADAPVLALVIHGLEKRGGFESVLKDRKRDLEQKEANLLQE